jgi:hypothetical protein
MEKPMYELISETTQEWRNEAKETNWRDPSSLIVLNCIQSQETVLSRVLARVDAFLAEVHVRA